MASILSVINFNNFLTCYNFLLPIIKYYVTNTSFDYAAHNILIMTKLFNCIQRFARYIRLIIQIEMQTKIYSIIF